MARRVVAIVLIILLAAALRMRAVYRLPIDFDEPVYLRAAAAMSAALRAGDLAALPDADTAAEHPALAKLVFAVALLAVPPVDPGVAPDVQARPEAYGITRVAAAALGVAHVALLAVVDPVAGALLAVQAYTVKYTAQVYLEALPMLTASLCVLADRRGSGGAGGRGSSGAWGWLALSAVALGLTAASKYIYAAAGVAVALDWLWRIVETFRWNVSHQTARHEATSQPNVSHQAARHEATSQPNVSHQTARHEATSQPNVSHQTARHEATSQPNVSSAVWPLLAWAGLALAVFVAANPNLWPDPIGRLAESLAFHAAYSQGAHVQQSGYPWFQPFVWLVSPQPAQWHPGTIMCGLEPVIALLGVLGAARIIRDEGWGRGDGKNLTGSGLLPSLLPLPPSPGNRVVVLWWAVGLVFTLLWATKWPQYSLIMTAPMCLCAAEGLRLARRWLRVGATSHLDQ